MTNAFTVTALPNGFTVVNGHEGYPTLNNSGAVAGWIGANATVYQNGHTTTVPLSGLRAINDLGDAIGEDANGASYLYKDGKLAPLNGGALSINNTDVIVGTIGQSDPSLGNQPAYLYPNASPKPMESNPPTDTIPSLINNRGEVGGEQMFGPIGNGYSPFLYPNLALCENGNSYGGQVLGLNDNNHVLFRDDTSPASAFFLCKGAQATLISGSPEALNNDDVVVGQGYRSSTDPGFAFVRTSEGKYWDLNSLVPAGTPHLSDAVAINNHDVILAAQTQPNTTSLRYYLLTPTSRWYGL
ncbi:MAG TPA: hypothetical protein VFN49_13510 [Candidatus Aquilonibacter sp.]|nr:hypothetical protein [Candidatus Aquilonibacter sp.]